MRDPSESSLVPKVQNLSEFGTVSATNQEYSKNQSWRQEQLVLRQSKGTWEGKKGRGRAREGAWEKPGGPAVFAMQRSMYFISGMMEIVKVSARAPLCQGMVES